MRYLVTLGVHVLEGLQKLFCLSICLCCHECAFRLLHFYVGLIGLFEERLFAESKSFGVTY